MRSLLGKYRVSRNLGPDFFSFIRLDPDTAWGQVFEWILKAGPIELSKFVTWRRNANKGV